ncbi:DUF2752 domain-containing protein [Actinomadura algeriensis]|uniref:DUF2752 domain-containing protein n=1 Tax=Actinomadura algeriensis TaxID=1679523 RepID=A0ABR9K124_9ACTN|nr:DUF2752 domain-containing protein [Actinomadura algeriensis]MBE1536541.1 hypothetical protein [Actinomadura algeriensis]
MARRLSAPAGMLLAAAAAAAYVGAIDPNEQGNYPTCPFLALTGYQCPGCGALRTIHALAHARIGEAISLNVFAVVMLLVLAFFWIRWTVARVRDRPHRTKAAPAWAIWTFLGFVLAYWLVRNLPFGAALAA